MSSVIKLPPCGTTVTKMDCECGYALEFWMGDDNCAYGMCSRCNLESISEITVPLESTGDVSH